MRSVLIVLTAMVGVLILAAIAVPFVVTGPFVAERVAAAIEERTGRAVTYGDEITFSLYPTRFALQDVRIANAPGADTVDMLRVGAVDIAVDPVAYLTGGTIAIDRLVVQSPALNIEVAADGTINLPGGTPAGRTDPQPTPETSAETNAETNRRSVRLRLGEVRIDDAQIRYRNAATGQDLLIEQAGLTASLPDPDAALQVDGAAVVNGQAVMLAVQAAPLNALLNGQPGDLTAQIGSALASAEVTLTADPAGQQAEGSVVAALPDLPGLVSWLDLPQATAEGLPVRTAAFRGELALGPSRTGLPSFRLQADTLVASGQVLADLSGPVPVVEGDVTLDPLALDPFLEALGATGPDTAAAPAGSGAESGAVAGDGALSETPLPETPLPWEALRSAQIDLRLQTRGATLAEHQIGPSTLSVTLRDGVLVADLAETEALEGRIAANLQADASARRVAADVTVAGVQLGPVAEALAVAQARLPIDGSLTFESEGETPATLVAAARGAVSVSVVDGRLVLDGPDGPQAVEAIDLSARMDDLDGPLTVDGGVTLNGEPMTVAFMLAEPRRAVDGSGAAIDLSVESAVANASVVGTGAAGPRFVGEVRLTVPSVPALVAWAPVPVPDAPIPVTTLSYAGAVALDGSRLALNGFEAVVDDMRAAGTLRATLGAEVPDVQGQLSLSNIDVDRLQAALAMMESGEAGADRTGGAAPTAPAPDADALPWDLLRQAAVDLTVDLDNVRVQGLPIGPGQVTVRVAEGRLALDVPTLDALGGRMTAQASADADAQRLEVAADLQQVEVGALAVAFGPFTEARLPVTAAVSVQGTGGTRTAFTDAMVAALNLSVAGGAVTLPDPTTGAPVRASEIAVSAALPAIDGPLTVVGDLSLEGRPLSLSLRADQPRALAAGIPGPVAVTVESSPVSAMFQGTAGPGPVAVGPVRLSVPSVPDLMAWLPVDAGAEVPVQSLQVAGSLDMQGRRISVPDLQSVIDGTPIEGSVMIEQGAVPSLAASLSTGVLNVDRYLGSGDAGASPGTDGGASPGTDAAGTPETGGGAPGGGWSTEPIDLSALRTVNAAIDLNTGGLIANGIEIGPTAVQADLSNGRLTLSIPSMPMFGGAVGLAAALDGSGPEMVLDAQAQARGIAAAPMLEAFADNRRIAGTTELDLAITTRGRSQADLMAALNGTLSAAFRDGALRGINIAALLRDPLGYTTGAEETRETDFSELSAGFTIENGRARTDNLAMLAPLFRIDGAGIIDLPARQLDLRLNPTAVGSLEGQGGQFQQAGIRVPVLVTGSFDNPRIRPDLTGVALDIIEDPTRAADVVQQIREGADPATLLQGLLGGGAGAAAQPDGAPAPAPTSTEDAVRNVLQGVLGGGAPAPAPADGQEGQTEETPPPAANPTQDLINQGVNEGLRRLFGN